MLSARKDKLKKTSRNTSPSETDEVVILAYDADRAPREVEIESRLIASQVVQVEDKLLGQVLLLAEDYPSYTWKHETVLVARHVDASHARHTEVPLDIRVYEWRDESSGGRINVDINVPSARSPTLE